MMNIEVLEEQWLNSGWLSCSCFQLIGFVFLGCFQYLNFWAFRLLGILSDWGEIHGSLEGIEIKNVEEKSKRLSDKPWGSGPTISRLDNLYPSVSSEPSQIDPHMIDYVRQDMALHGSQSSNDTWRPCSFPIFSYKFPSDVPIFLC